MRNYLKYSLILYLAFNFHVKAQENLIENGSFEEIDSCFYSNSVTSSTIQIANGWFDAASENVTLISSDLFNICFSNNLGVPNNWYGFQEPYEGNGYAGILINAYPQGGGYREFLQNDLVSPVLKGCKYEIEFQFSYSSTSSFKTDGLFFIFSKNRLLINNDESIINETFFEFNVDSVTILRFQELLEADTTNWFNIKREFFSNSDANYLTIGSISDTSSTFNEFGWFVGGVGLMPFCRGYFDDIRLIQLDSTCVTGVNEVEKKDVVKVYPNPASNSLNIDNGQNGKPYTAQLIDAFGRIVQQSQFSGIGSHTLNLEGLAQGIYYCRIMQGNEVVVVEKVVKVQ